MARMGDLMSYVTVFIIVGIMAIIGLYIVASVYGSIQTSSIVSPALLCVGVNNSPGGCYTGTQINNSYTNGTYSVAQMLSWMPIIGIIIAAAVVLGLLLHDLFGGSRRSE